MPSETLAGLRIALVDKSESVHRSVRRLFASHGCPVTLDCYSNAEQAFERLTAVRPNVLLLDIEEPGVCGIEWVRRAGRLLSGTSVLVLTRRHDMEAIRLSLLAGACGYLIKPVGPTHLLAAIASAAEGWPVLCPQSLQAILAASVAAGAEGCLSTLTQRELEVVAWLGQNASSKDIAEHLGIATQTVRVHRRSAFRKLGVKNRRQAVQKLFHLQRKGQPAPTPNYPISCLDAGGPLV